MRTANVVPMTSNSVHPTNSPFTLSGMSAVWFHSLFRTVPVSMRSKSPIVKLGIGKSRVREQGSQDNRSQLSVLSPDFSSGNGIHLPLHQQLGEVDFANVPRGKPLMQGSQQ